jgi:hypothetical protein
VLNDLTQINSPNVLETLWRGGIPRKYYKYQGTDEGLTGNVAEKIMSFRQFLLRRLWADMSPIEVMAALPPKTDNKNVGKVNAKNTFSGIGMQILGGFITVVGVAAVAIAFAALNAATFGIAGLVVAGLGIAALITGVGLFAGGLHKEAKAAKASSANQQALTLAPAVAV